MKDPNPVYDPGAPRSIGGMHNAARLCEVLEIDFEIQPPQDLYMHGWGEQCHDPKPVIGVWEITLLDVNRNPCTLCFDLIEGDSVLVVGLDVGKFALQDNISQITTLKIKRPEDNSVRIFETYISIEDSNQIVQRLRIELAARPSTCVRSLMSSTLTTRARREPILFAKRIHRATHAPADQVIAICRQAGILTPALQEAIENVHAACDICTSSGRPKSSSKISLAHVNEAFNMEVQVDFCFEFIKDRRQTIFLITDTGTGFTEGAITAKRNLDDMCKLFEQLWIFKHGAPTSLSADDEYNRGKMRSFLESHYITFKQRPTRRHNKTGIIERKVQTVKSIIRKIDREISNNTSEEIVTRAIFLSNLFSGSRLLSSFQLVRGFQPSILGISTTKVPQSLLDAHVEQSATRALQRALKAKPANAVREAACKKGDPIWVWYSSSKGNERDEWIRAQVVNVHEHFMEVRRIKDGKPSKGPMMRPAYEDVRLAPKSALTQELMACSLEDALYKSVKKGESSKATTKSDFPPNINALLAAQAAFGSNYSIGDIGMISPQGPALAYSQLDKEPGFKLIRTGASKAIEKDIGISANDISGPARTVQILESDMKRVLDEIYEQIGSQQVTKRQLEFAPSWVCQKAFNKEFEDNWRGAFQEIHEEDIPMDANIIRSHVVYKIKTDEAGHRKLKARLCPHGNEDAEKDQVRKDSANAQLSIVRLLLSLTSFLGFKVCTADIKGAFLQSGPIQREIYFKPPREWHYVQKYRKGVLWKLLKMPYGIVEAGRQWMIASEEWMIKEAGLKRVFGISQLFVKRNTNGKIVLLVAKLTDDFLACGNGPMLNEFFSKMQERFEVGMINHGPSFKFGGCEIEINKNGDIKISMKEYWNRIQAIQMTRLRRKAKDCLANAREIQQYRALAGTLLYLGNGTLPQASYVVSLMQQRVSRLKVKHLIDANNMLAELRKLSSTIFYQKVDTPYDVCLFSLSDASHPKDRDYGQTGILIGILARNGKEGKDVYHLIDWTSHKQHRVSYSPYGAEILAAATADDREYYMKNAINTLFPQTPVKHELNIDSKGLWDTITTLHEGKEYRLRQTVQRLRNSFEAEETEIMRWIPGPLNIADALTKLNVSMFQMLDRVCASGYLRLDFQTSRMVDSHDW